MTIEEMIKHLEVFPKDWEVLITDGFKCNYYKGYYKILPWEYDDGKMCIEIGIGGCGEYDESEEYEYY